jgi:hypothetical protein
LLFALEGFDSLKLQDVCKVDHSWNLDSKDDTTLCLVLKIQGGKLSLSRFLEELKESNHDVEGGNPIGISKGDNYHS